MNPQHPPTPPANGADCHTNLHQVARYNADRSFCFGDPDFASAGMTVHKGIPSRTSRIDSHTGEGLGLGITYDGYGPPAELYQNGQYNDGSNGHTMFSPPTPRSTIDDDQGRRLTRSGRAHTASSSPKMKERSPRPKAMPRTRKTKAGKADKASTPKLTAPLSSLTADLIHIPVKDMEQWVNRPADVRRREAERRNGYITRPMNSFMLYRSAYADRAKAWCAQNNHQIVSSVAGESWPLEPPEIRDLYNEYAKVERINHQNAHPTYKFSPSKTPLPPRKRKGEWSDDDDSSGMEDAEWAPGTGRSRPRQARRIERSLSYPVPMAADFFDRSFGPNGLGVNKSSWEMTNEGRPMPLPMHNDMYGQYYQTTTYPGMHMGHGYAEDLRMRRGGTPSSISFPSNHALLGLPGGHSVDLMQQMSSQATTPFDDGQLDPMLLAFEGHHGAIDPLAIHHQDYRHGHPTLLDEKLDVHHMESLLNMAPSHDEHHHENWQSDPTMASLEHESEFDKWIGEH